MDFRAKIRIVGVSDVGIGYGSPIIPFFMNSVVDYYGDAEGVLIEPDQPEAPPRHSSFPTLSIKRILTTFHPHNEPGGRIEYIYRVAEEVKRIRPDILVIFCTYSLPVLFKLHPRPPFVIYYAIELTSPYGQFDIVMGRHINSLVDLIIYPEENRAVIDAQLCGFRDVPIVILFNCANSLEDSFNILSPEARNGRILYAGTIDIIQTCFDYFLHEKMQHIAVDLFGKPSGIYKEKTQHALSNLKGAVRYLGYVDGQQLRELRKAYCYSIIIWRPLDDNHFYACPNKFFEAIADGVPPITAPHPQCKMLVNRYKCGIVMRDWSFDAFYEALQQGVKIYGTTHYAEMVENCRKAVIQELNWEKQFEKINPYLKEVR